MGWITFLTGLNGFDQNVALEFSINLKHLKEEEYAMRVKGLRIDLNEERISTYTSIPKGLHQGKHDRESAMKAKQDFFAEG